MKLHCPHCNQLLEAADSMSGQAIKCPACSGDLRVPTVADSKPPSQSVQPEPSLRQALITKSRNPGQSDKPEHPPEPDPAVLQPTPAGRRAPGSVSSLVLGILSIPLALVIGGYVFLLIAFGSDDEVLVFHFGSLMLGILAIVQAAKAKRAIQSSAGRYDGHGMATAGMVCAIIGITTFLFFMFAILSEI